MKVIFFFEGEGGKQGGLLQNYNPIRYSRIKFPYIKFNQTTSVTHY